MTKDVLFGFDTKLYNLEFAPLIIGSRTFSSSHRSSSIKKMSIKIRRKTPALKSLYNKVADPETLLKHGDIILYPWLKETAEQSLSCEFCKIFKNVLITEYLRVATSRCCTIGVFYAVLNQTQISRGKLLLATLSWSNVFTCSYLICKVKKS